MISGSIERKLLKEIGYCYHEGFSKKHVRSSMLVFGPLSHHTHNTFGLTPFQRTIPT